MAFSVYGATVKSKSKEELVLDIAGKEQKLSDSGIEGIVFKVHSLQLAEQVWADGRHPLLLNNTSLHVFGDGECDSGTLHILTHPGASSKRVRVQVSPLPDEYKKRIVASWAAGVEKDMIFPARLHFFEAVWEDSRDASWQVSIYVEPDIYRTLAEQVRDNRIRSMQFHCKFKNLYSTSHNMGPDDFVLAADASDWTTKSGQGECKGYDLTLEQAVFARGEHEVGTSSTAAPSLGRIKTGMSDEQVEAVVTAVRKASAWIGGCVMIGALMVSLALK